MLFVGKFLLFLCFSCIEFSAVDALPEEAEIIDSFDGIKRDALSRWATEWTPYGAELYDVVPSVCRSLLDTHTCLIFGGSGPDGGGCFGKTTVEDTSHYTVNFDVGEDPDLRANMNSPLFLPTDRTAAIIFDTVIIANVPIECWELGVLENARRLLRSGGVLISGNFSGFVRDKDWKEIEDAVSRLERLMKVYGFERRDLFIEYEGLLRSLGWDDPRDVFDNVSFFMKK